MIWVTKFSAFQSKQHDSRYLGTLKIKVPWPKQPMRPIGPPFADIADGPAGFIAGTILAKLKCLKTGVRLFRLFVACQGPVIEGLRKPDRGSGSSLIYQGHPAARPSAGRTGHAGESFPGLSFYRRQLC